MSDHTSVHGMHFDPFLALDAPCLVPLAVSIHHPGEDDYLPDEAYSYTCWFTDDDSIFSQFSWYI